MRLHILGLPHTRTSSEFSTCAYTQKVVNLCKMMMRRGHEVYHYGTAGSTPECTEHIETISAETWERCYGAREATEFYKFGLTDPAYMEFSQRTNAALKERVRPWQDIVCCPWGVAHKTAVEGVETFIVESGIGYPETFARFRVFESYAWMHFHLGHEGKWSGRCWEDTVIENYYDPMLFRFQPVKEDYFLYLGRIQADKGVQIAVETCRAIGAPLIICGQGDPAPFLEPHVVYRPPVGIDERRELLAHTRGLFAPTHYVEPWGGVVIEAQASGTPVLTTNHGAFTENVLHGITGYRCQSHSQFIWAAEHITEISPQACRDWAQNFTLEAVAPRYEEYFQMVLDRARGGWYEPHPDRSNLSWLRKVFPEQMVGVS